MLGRTRALLSVYYAFMMAYRAELVLWALSNSLPFILMGLWVEAGASGRFALGAVDFARYFLAVFVVRQLTTVWVVWEFEYEVVEGRLSSKLLQPLDPVWRHVAGHVAERGARLPFTVLIIAVFFALDPAALWTPEPERAVLFVLLVLATFAVRFLIQYTFALLAFWTERASSLEQLWYLFYMFLSGYVAPLAVFPETAREVALWTPFPYLVDLPVACILGLPIDLGQATSVLGCWTVAFAVLNRFLWRRGLLRYTAMGA